MKIYNEVHDYEDIIERKLLNAAHLSLNFDKIPPIIGIITANQYGNTLMVFEYNFQEEDHYNPINSYLSENEKNLLDVDLISMYFSSLKSFAGDTNIQNLSNFEIHGSNIKIQIYFLFEKFMIIIFLNSKVDLNLKEKRRIIRYFKDMLSKHEFEFKHYNATKSREIIRRLENTGKAWLKRINREYMKTYQNAFLKKHDIIEVMMNKINSIIKEELVDFLKKIPEDIIVDVVKEICGKIQDKICEFKFE